MGLRLINHTGIYVYLSAPRKLIVSIRGFRSLDGANSPLCPCLCSNAMVAGNRPPSSFLFPRNIYKTIGIPLRWSATAHGLDPARFASHSLRSGGGRLQFLLRVCRLSSSAVLADGHLCVSMTICGVMTFFS